MEPDVRPFLPRIEQAAYDVVFNKAVWHTPSKERRDALQHQTATTSASGTELRCVLGAVTAFGFQIVDPFGTWPMDLNGVLTSPPADWWCRTAEREGL